LRNVWFRTYAPVARASVPEAGSFLRTPGGAEAPAATTRDSSPLGFVAFSCAARGVRGGRAGSFGRGYGPGVETPVAVERPRNWAALVALWTALVTWLILIGALVASQTFASEDIFDWVAWVALGFGTAGLILAVLGITMIRTRGETAVAILALVLVLSLTSFTSPLFFYGLGGG
jgi:hypothetical protein